MSGMAEVVTTLVVFRRRLRLQRGDEIGEAARNTAETAAALDLARQLLRDTRDELARADQKAASLITAVGVGGALMTSAVAAVGSPASLARPTLVAGLAALLATTLAVMFLIGVLMPRLPRHRDKRRVAYFGDVTRIHDRSAQEESGEAASVNLETAVRRAATNALTHTVDELAVVSKIAWLKYRHVRNAIICLGVAAVSLGLAATLQVAFVAHPTRPPGHGPSHSAG